MYIINANVPYGLKMEKALYCNFGLTSSKSQYLKMQVNINKYPLLPDFQDAILGSVLQFYQKCVYLHRIYGKQ